MAENKNNVEEEKKQEESKKKEEKEDSKKEKEKPSEEERKFEYKVFMHCEGCAKKLKKSLRGFQGVEDVVTDCKGSKVVVKGKTVDPLKVLDRLQHKSHRKVEILTQLPETPAEDAKKAEEEEKETAKEEEKKEEIPVVVVVTLKVHMHCEACAQGLKKRIRRMKGVESANPDPKSSLVVVKGIFTPQELVEYVYKKVGKHAEIVKQETEKKKEEKEKEGGEEDKDEDDTKVEVRKNEFYYYYTKYNVDCLYPPQIFSDENPNACSVM
ncbi:hypothetical protein AAC387_Pa02g1776 [Persea americana]